MSSKEKLRLVKLTYKEWGKHQAPRWGASVAFYSLLSFAPLLILITAVIALAFGEKSAQSALIEDARQLIGDRGAETVRSLLKNAQRPASGLVAFATLLFGASGVFTELQDALNLIWGVSLEGATELHGMVKKRILSFGMVLSVGFLLLISLLLSVSLAYMGRSFGQLLPLPPSLLEAINLVISFAVITFLFALMLKYVPAAKIFWRDVWVAAIGTALLFTVGKLLFGLYLGKASVGSVYGAAGSLVGVIVWIYYSAQIFFFGAEFAHVYSESRNLNSGGPLNDTSVSQEEEAEVSVYKAVQSTVQNSVSAAQAKTIVAVGQYPSLVLSMPVESPVCLARTVMHEKKLPARQSTATLFAGYTPCRSENKSAPKLIMAVGLGFLLGCFFARKSGQQRRR
jgi:membrane protein